MKKCLLILLFGFCFTISGSAFAGDVRDINSEAWLEHVTQMHLLRQQILRIVTKSDQNAKDRDMLDALNRAFDEEKSTWDSYLIKIAQGKESAVKGAKHHKGYKHHAKEKAHECPKGDECCGEDKVRVRKYRCRGKGCGKGPGNGCGEGHGKGYGEGHGKGCGKGHGKGCGEGHGKGCGEGHGKGCGGDCCK